MVDEPRPLPQRSIDCVVVGAGPAGLSAATWLRALEIPFLIVEHGSAIGGELVRINRPITNYLGLCAVDGRAFLARLQQEIDHDVLPVLFSHRALAIDPARKLVRLADQIIEARALILAMGLRRRELGLPGIAGFRGRGVSLSATTDLEQIRGQPVAVVGGGDGALENALILAEACPAVHLIIRYGTAHGRQAFFEQARAHPRITLHMSSEVVEVAGDERGLSQVRVRGPAGEAWLAVRWLVVKIGFAPDTQALVPGSLTCDKDGYIITDNYLRTNVPGVFVAGDLRNPRSPSLAAAVGDGAVTAREVAFFLGRLTPPDGP
jgi:thioredoxin reductase (NADPH)